MLLTELKLAKLAKWVNFSLTLRTVQLVWKTAHITPVPNTNRISGPRDFTSYFSDIHYVSYY